MRHYRAMRARTLVGTAAIGLALVCGACGGSSTSGVKSKVRKELLDGGMPADQANCITAALDKLSKADLDALASGRGLSKDGAAAFDAATGPCADLSPPAT